MGNAKETTKMSFNSEDWVPAIKRWSATGVDPSTSSKGVTIYFPNEDASFSAKSSDGKSTLLVFTDTRNAQPSAEPKTVLMLKMHGGRVAYEALPDEGYININPQYSGVRFMSTSDYEALCQRANIPVEVVATALDKWITSRK